MGTIGDRGTGKVFILDLSLTSGVLAKVVFSLEYCSLSVFLELEATMGVASNTAEESSEEEDDLEDEDVNPDLNSESILSEL